MPQAEGLKQQENLLVGLVAHIISVASTIARIDSWNAQLDGAECPDAAPP
jgi:hypothetical protein